MPVLVIDDSRAMRAILRSALKPLGYDIVEASNGQEGLDRMASSGPFELALVDWNMPVMNGLEFVTRVRQEPQFDSMRIVMVTTEVEQDQMIKALDAGANEYVMKPFTVEGLREKLELLGTGTDLL